MTGPRHVVTWPRAAFQVPGKGGTVEDVVVERGGDVPAGVDEKVLEDLRIQGAVALAAPVSDSTGSSTASGADRGLPNKSASRGEWDSAATALGVDPGEYAKKPELIDAVTAAFDALNPAPADQGDEANGSSGDDTSDGDGSGGDDGDGSGGDDADD